MNGAECSHCGSCTHSSHKCPDNRAEENKCKECKGTGWIPVAIQPCPICKGTGKEKFRK